MTERAGGRGQPRCTTVVANRRRLDESGALEHERTRPHRLPRHSHHRLRFPGQVGLIERKPVRALNGPVRRHLVARSKPHDIPHHELIDRNPSIGPVPDHDHFRRDQRGKPVQRPLRANLLKRPDRDVRDQDPEKQGVLPRPERQGQHAEDKQDPVRDRQRVSANDARVGPARPLTRKRTACYQTPRGLRLGQTRRFALGYGGDQPTLTAPAARQVRRGSFGNELARTRRALVDVLARERVVAVEVDCAVRLEHRLNRVATSVLTSGGGADGNRRSE